MTPTDDILNTFASEWAQVPPLVRASVAANLALARRRESHRAGDDVALEESMGMARRAAVTRDFAAALGMVSDLFARLATVADNEAEALSADLQPRTPKLSVSDLLDNIHNRNVL